MWQSTRLIEIDLGVLKYGRMQLKDLPRFDGVILCYDSLVPASYEALPNLMGGSSRRLRHRPNLPCAVCISPCAASAYGTPRIVTLCLISILIIPLSSWVSSSRHAVHCGWLSCRLTRTSIPRGRGGRLLAIWSRTRVDDDDNRGRREENAGRLQLDRQGGPPTA